MDYDSVLNSRPDYTWDRLSLEEICLGIWKELCGYYGDKKGLQNKYYIRLVKRLRDLQGDVWTDLYLQALTDEFAFIAFGGDFCEDMYGDLQLQNVVDYEEHMSSWIRTYVEDCGYGN